MAAPQRWGGRLLCQPVSVLLLHNARVRTMDAAGPSADAVAVRDGRIVAVGSEAEAARSLDDEARRVDCGGATLLPAFIDTHCHLLAYAASLRAVDCSGASCIADIQELIRRRAAATAAGEWLRAFGYEETALAEQRHPNRHDLDAATSTHPVRLIHGSGHASVLNSLALKRAGIDIATEEPPGGSMERDLTSGEPSGLLLDMEQVIEAAIPRPSYEELAAGVRQAAERFLEGGVVCVQDATHTNGRPEWDLFERLIADGSLPIQVVLMEGIDHLGTMPEQSQEGRLRRGPVKIMLREMGDALSPDERELVRQVAEAHGAGRQVAIHAVTERAVTAATEAIEAALREKARAGHRHRIEHCSLLPQGLAPRLARLGVIVVSQPLFVRERGERYLRLVPEDEQAHLYSFRTLRDAGVALAAGSDAPVASPLPLAAAAAAIDRRTAGGRAVAPEQAVGVEDALGWWTAGAARAAGLDGERGMLRPGLRADFALMKRDPAACSSRELRKMPVQEVWAGGQSVWRRSP